MTEQFPIRFGRYELVERIAVGGMAEIFRARVRGAEGFEKIVVIKRLLPHMTEDAHFNEMFIDEAKLTARLAHPKIAQTYELGRHEEQLYIAMELVDGIDALALLRESARRRTRVPPQLGVHIVGSVLDALEFAHGLTDAEGRSAGIIHRDLSPSNVLLSRRGDVKLVDFGIARSLEQNDATQAGTLKGKYGYMSPEQVLGEALDVRSDLFAMGIVLCELLTGRRLFAASNELDVLLMVRDVRLGRLEKFGGHLDSALRAIVNKALSKPREERFQSAAEFREVLDDWMFTNRFRVTARDVATQVEDYYADVVNRRRSQMASVALSTTAAPPEPGAPATGRDRASGRADTVALGPAATYPDAPGVEDHAANLTSRAKGLGADGIPTGVLSVTESMPIISIESEGSDAPPRDIPRLELDLQPPPGDIGRELDLQLASATEAHDKGPAMRSWSGVAPDAATAGEIDRRASDGAEAAEDTEISSAVDVNTADAIPEALSLDAPKSARYPSIADAVAAVSLLDLDPAARDFDDKAVAPETEGHRKRMPTVEEVESAPVPGVPVVERIGDKPDQSGNFIDTPPIRVLYELTAPGTTGLLVVSVGSIRKEIYIVDSVPVFVSSNLAKELFGEYLVAEGVVSAGELAMALAMMPHYGGKLGDTLVGLGLMKPLEVFRMLTRQVRSKLIDVCTWSKGEYAWYQGRKNEREAFPLDLDSLEVLGAGAQAISASWLATWVDANADRRPRSCRNERLQPEDFRLEGARSAYDALTGRSTLAQMRGRYTDANKQQQCFCLLYLFVNTSLATFDS